MGRRRNNFVPTQNETLSQETPKVQTKIINELFGKSTDVSEVKEKSMKEIFENTTAQDMVDEMKRHGAKEIPIKKVELKKVEFKVGDNVKLNKDVKFDLLGKRIHEGLRNYNYRILSIRIDGMLIIECLTHCFTVKPEDVYKI